MLNVTVHVAGFTLLHCHRASIVCKAQCWRLPEREGEQDSPLEASEKMSPHIGHLAAM